MPSNNVETLKEKERRFEKWDEAVKANKISHLIFMNFPHLKTVEGFADFIDNLAHIEFEKADLKNNTDKFDEMVMSGYLNCMCIHMKNTVFEWKNWKKYIKATNLDKIILAKGDMRQKVDKDELYKWADDNIEDFF